MTTISLSIAYDQQKLGLLLGAVALVAAPHVQNLGPAVMAYFALVAAWRGAALYRKVSLPSKAVLFVLTLGGAAVVFWQYHRFWGQEAGSSLFIVMLGLKLMELKNLRDAYLVVFLAFFVALTQYLFSQSIPMAAYTLAVVVLLVAAMIGLNSNADFPVRARLKMAGSMVAQALPVMLLLFVFFPRIPGPLWTLPDDHSAAKSGLSDTMSPGSVSRVAQSPETAFRVDFEGEPPPAKLRYWRGPVFWRSNGVSWSLSPEIPLNPSRQPVFDGQSFTYTVTLEPHQQRWIYALDLPQRFPMEFEETAEYQLMAKDAISERKQYKLSSGTVYTTGPLSRNEAKKGLEVPGTPSARLTELVAGWKAESPEPNQLVARALRYFREEPFFYTLSPPLTTGDPTESFLFETRRGFCEHYAAAFVVLMRLGGVPARVVTGYQGGQWNSVGGFLEVKQSDAHAWAEVWLPESGWTRVDPTAAVAPQRIESGLDVAGQLAGSDLRFNAAERADAKGMRLATLWRRARMLAASIDHAWDSWVLSYDQENQGHLLQWLGAVNWRSVAGWLGLGVGLIGGLAIWLLLPKRRAQTDPAKRIYDQFLDKLARGGFVQQTGEGPRAFAERVARAAPELAEPTGHITRLYLRLRYERSHGPDDLKNLRRLVAALPRRVGAKPNQAHGNDPVPL
jgi:transglutaminase-like putative cysteine protease